MCCQTVNVFESVPGLETRSVNGDDFQIEGRSYPSLKKKKRIKISAYMGYNITGSAAE